MSSHLTKKDKLTNKEVAQLLEDFIEGRGSPWAWDDFTEGMSFEHEHHEEIRRRCAGLSREFPPDSPGEYCNGRGQNIIREYAKQLRVLAELVGTEVPNHAVQKGNGHR